MRALFGLHRQFGDEDSDGDGSGDEVRAHNISTGVFAVLLSGLMNMSLMLLHDPRCLRTGR